jgi:hypothetical protein
MLRISSVKNQKVFEQAKGTLSGLQNFYSFLESHGADISGFPPLHVGPEEHDGSLLLEIPFTNFRIGFGIERNPSESSWFLVSKDDAGSVAASGRLEGGLSRDLLTVWLTLYGCFDT